MTGKRIVDGLNEANKHLQGGSAMFKPREDGKAFSYNHEGPEAILPLRKHLGSVRALTDDQVQDAVAWALATAQIKCPKGTIIKGDVFCLPDGTRFKVVVLPKS